jgi:hypothetical protein
MPAAFEEGHSTFANNIQRFLRYLLSFNIGEVLTRSRRRYCGST